MSLDHNTSSGPDSPGTTYEDVRRIERYGQYWIVAQVTDVVNGVAQTSFQLLSPKAPVAPYDPQNHSPDWVNSEQGLPAELLQPADYEGMTFDVHRREGVLTASPSSSSASADALGFETLFRRVNGPGFVAACNAAMVLERDTGRTPTRNQISRILADDSRLIPRPPESVKPITPPWYWSQVELQTKKSHPGFDRHHPQQQATFEGFACITAKPLAGMGMCSGEMQFANWMEYVESDGYESNPHADDPEYVAGLQRQTDGGLLAAAMIREQFPKAKLTFDGIKERVSPVTPVNTAGVDRTFVVRA